MFHSSHVLQIEAEGEGIPLNFYQLYSMITNDQRTSDYIILYWQVHQRQKFSVMGKQNSCKASILEGWHGAYGDVGQII